jgi:hypothetical protein
MPVTDGALTPKSSAITFGDTTASDPPRRWIALR